MAPACGALVYHISELMLATLIQRFYKNHFISRTKDYCPFDITRKDVFCLAFYFKWKYFVLSDYILSEPFVFSVFVFCSQICTLKLNLWTKIGLTYAISRVKWFLEFLIKKIVFKFLCRIWIIDISQQYCENFRKIEQAELVENLPPSYLPYRFLHNLHSFLLWGKVKILDFLKTND